MNLSTRFRVSKAPPAVQVFVRNLYHGIEKYFSMPEETSWLELQRVLYWKAYDAKRQELERIWGPRFEAVLKVAGKRVGVVYRETQSVERCQRSVDSQMAPAVKTQMEACILETERVFLGRLRSSFQQRKDEWELVDPHDVDSLINWNIDNVAQKITRISDSTKQDIADTIFRAVKRGEAIPEIVDALEASYAFSRYRGYLIARTEIISSSNAATHFGMSYFVPPKSLKKDWLATGDRRTRPTHQKAGNDQKDVVYEDPFKVGGSYLMFPGDGSLGASAKETIQCRCTALYSSKQEPALTPAPPPSPASPNVPLPRIPRTPPRPTPPPAAPPPAPESLSPFEELLLPSTSDSPVTLNIKNQRSASGKAIAKELNKSYRSAPDIMKRALEKGTDPLEWVGDTASGSYYSPSGNELKISIKRKGISRTDTLRHEFGHHFDHRARTNGGVPLHKLARQDGGLLSAIREAQDTIADWKRNDPRRYKQLVQRVRLVPGASENATNISDLFGALTKGEMGGGHTYDYYNRPGGAYSEIMAQLFSIVGTGPRARRHLELLQEICPSMVTDFHAILKRLG